MKLYDRSGRKVLEGTSCRMRDLSWRSLALVVRRRPGYVAEYALVRFRRWAALPGDRFYDLERDVQGEVLEVKPRGVLMLVTPGEFARHYFDDEPPLDRLHVRLEPRDLGRWSPA